MTRTVWEALSRCVKMDMNTRTPFQCGFDVHISPKRADKTEKMEV